MSARHSGGFEIKIFLSLLQPLCTLVCTGFLALLGLESLGGVPLKAPTFRVTNVLEANVCAVDVQPEQVVKSPWARA